MKTSSQTILLALDDSDHPEGGCTTYTISKIIDELCKLDSRINFIGYPILFRCNPNIPFKTRGNGSTLVKFQSNLPLEDIFEVSKALVIEHTKLFLSSDATAPTLVVARDSDIAINQDLCTSILSEFISFEHVLSFVPNEALVWPKPPSRAIVGILGALHADFSTDSTYELLLYRQKTNLGTQRVIDSENVARLQQKYSTVFGSFDSLQNRELIAPSGPDPVFCGIRGDDVGELLSFAEGLKLSEDIASKTIFVTNQGTDQHVSKTRNKLSLYSVVAFPCTINDTPLVLEGGHVKLKTLFQGKAFTIMVFEPTKELAKAASLLQPADEVFIHGAIMSFEGEECIHLEKLRIIDLVARTTSSPVLCPNCEKKTTSAGFLKGYKCKSCNFSTFKHELIESKPPFYVNQVIYASKSAQRHLTRPAERYLTRSLFSPTHLTYHDVRIRN